MAGRLDVASVRQKLLSSPESSIGSGLRTPTWSASDRDRDRNSSTGQQQQQQQQQQPRHHQRAYSSADEPTGSIGVLISDGVPAWGVSSPGHGGYNSAGGSSSGMLNEICGNGSCRGCRGCTWCSCWCVGCCGTCRCYSQRVPPGHRRLRWCCTVCCASLAFLVATLTIIAVVIRAQDRAQYAQLVPLLNATNCNVTDLSASPMNRTYSLIVPQPIVDLLSLHLPERELLGTIFCRLCQTNASCGEECLRGAHVVVDGDDGWYYRLFDDLTGAYHRSSSHASSVPQIGVPEGPVLETLLAGQTDSHDTWFQLEGSPWDPRHRVWASLIHLLDYFQYLFTGDNVGPLGSSSFTESNPMIIEWN